MGEVENFSKPSKKLQESRLARWFFPNYIQELQTMEDQMFSTAQNVNAELTLRLQRVEAQNRQLLNEDVGQYRDRWLNLASGDYNPDTIGFDEYKKMSDYDAQVIAGFDLIQMGVLMKPWRIRHKDEKLVDYLTKSLRNLRYPSFREAMKEMMKAIIFGSSVTEVVFDEYNGWWLPRHVNGLKTFDPERIRFFSDAYGNLLKIQQYGYLTDQPAQYYNTLGTGGIDLPLERCLIWSHEKRHGNWYGNALLKGCYKNWYIKDTMLKFANIAYERFGSPILLGTAQNVQDMAKIGEAIEHLYARSQAVIVKRDDKDPTKIEVLESKRKEMPFDQYIRYHDEMILRRMLIGQRLFEGGGGTYGPKVPLDIIFMRFEDFRMELMDVINDLLRMIVDLNWPVDEYPRLEFAPLTTLDQQQIRQSIYDAIDRKVVDKDEPWVRDELGFPEYRKPLQRIPGVPELPNNKKPNQNEEADRLDSLIEEQYWLMKQGKSGALDDDEDEEEEEGE